MKSIKKTKSIKDIENKNRPYTLKNIPEDVFTFILKIQNQIKQERNIIQYSFASAIYKIIRESKRCIEETIEKEGEAQK